MVLTLAYKHGRCLYKHGRSLYKHGRCLLNSADIPQITRLVALNALTDFYLMAVYIRQVPKVKVRGCTDVKPAALIIGMNSSGRGKCMMEAGR